MEQAWRIKHGFKEEDHPIMHVYSYLMVASEAAVHKMVGEELAKHLIIHMDKLPPGGSINDQSRKYRSESKVSDHAYYVISGKIQGTVGNVVKTIGADSLIYCPSNVKHNILNIGKTTAKVLRIAGCD